MANSELEALKQEIYNLARKEAESIIKEAEAKAKLIIQQAKQRAEEIIKSKIEHALREARRDVNLRIASIKMKKRAELIKIKEDYVKKAFDEAYKIIQEYPLKNNEEYKKVLFNLMLDSLKEIINYGDEFIVFANERDIILIREVLTEVEDKVFEMSGRRIHISIHDKPIASIGGIILSTKDNKVFFNNTFEARLQYVKEAYLHKIYEMLFEGKLNDEKRRN